MKKPLLGVLVSILTGLSWAHAEYPVTLENRSDKEWNFYIENNVNLFVKLQDEAGKPVVGERDGNQVELRMFVPAMDNLREHHSRALKAKTQRPPGVEVIEPMPHKFILVPPKNRLVLEFLGTHNQDSLALIHVVDDRGEMADNEGLTYSVYRQDGKSGYDFSIALATPTTEMLFNRKAPDWIQLTANTLPAALILPEHPLDVWTLPFPK